MIDTKIVVKTDHFDGPLSLLLYLVQKNEMEISNIEIGKITGQYLDYLNKMKELNFDIAGDFLYMAATLVYIKSKNSVRDDLVDTDFLAETAEDENLKAILSKEDLIKRLEQLQYFQRVGQKLWSLEKLGHDTFTRPKSAKKRIINSMLNAVDMSELTSAMISVLRREKNKFTTIQREKVTLKKKISYLKERLRLNEKYQFHELIECHDEIQDIVVTFILLLELARLGKLSIFQGEHDSNIYVEVLQEFESIDDELIDITVTQDEDLGSHNEIPTEGNEERTLQ